MANEIISTQKAPGAIGPYSQAVRAGDMLFTSGQLGLNPETGVLAEGVRAQADQALKNLGAILHEAGLDYKDVIKTVVFIKNMADFKTVNEVYAQYFTANYPARSCVEVAALPMGGLVEVECVARG
ncbi:MAG: RidA family protein [Christensenellales bacterium]|jgi:2-iminobutanoate/2-iminopropanoate deaminase|nr:RidA family protein [Clostridiales bacterium]MDY4198898.1 RidA family protein [Candidatus Fimadaptatus sp.]